LKREIKKGSRILCVDDNHLMLKSLHMGLNARGFEVLVASNVSEALRVFASRQGNFECVITDNNMLGGTGTELCYQLRKHGYQGFLFVMSGRPSEEELAIYVNLGVSHLFRKPSSLDTLVSMISTERLLLESPNIQDLTFEQ
jgi:DNA-binding response OmpR family regulator